MIISEMKEVFAETVGDEECLAYCPNLLPWEERESEKYK
jgi:hypothetical protein